MTYKKPCLYSITGKTATHCTDGSGPGGPHECSNGADFAVANCTNFGIGAHASCNAGTGASPSCVTGDGVDAECVDGISP